MTQEDKELLLKDLCARLPYDVMCQTDENGKIHKLKGINKHKGIWWYEFDGFRNIKPPKPYLRPMSSMTEEEKRDFPVPYYFEWIDSNFSLLCSNDEICASIGFDEMYEIMDWLNAHHFDYRGLIEKGLALEAPEGMYN